jgi:hypothetical protein
MKKTCLIVHGKKQDDACLSPGAATPDEHWAYQLLDAFSAYKANQHAVTYPEGVEVHWGGGAEQAISVRITPELWKNDQACFEHLMHFIRQNQLTYEFPCDMEECDTCERHPSCVANEHDLEAVSAVAVRCKKCPRAA